MATLAELLLAPNKRPQVIRDCVQLIDEEVGSKSGLGGIAVKGAYAVVKKVKPGIISESVDGLLDDFVVRLEPFFSDCQAQSQPIEAYFSGRAVEVANGLLSITDERAARTRHKALKKAYDKLRPTGVKHTAAAVPGIARVIAKHLG